VTAGNDAPAVREAADYTLATKRFRYDSASDGAGSIGTGGSRDGVHAPSA
jgi:hypothetical protein